MRNAFEIRYIDIGSPVFVEKRRWAGLCEALVLCSMVVFAIATNVLFESLCPNGGTMLTWTGIACAL